MNNNNNDVSYLFFDKGITDDRIYAHRGDIFVCEGLFKPINEIDKDDHIIGKENRPVLIISDDEYNQNIVKVLPFSSKSGSEDFNAISSSRMIRVPGINRNPNPNYIDVSQVFTINTYQLKIKLGHASQEIVDAAVAMHTLQNINSNSMDTLIRVLKDRYPSAQIFNQFVSNGSMSYHTMNASVKSPSEPLFTDVKRVELNDLLTEIKSTLKEPETKEDAYSLYEEWLSMGTDLFRNKYGLSKQQYYNLRDKCVTKMLGKIANFKRYDWSC